MPSKSFLAAALILGGLATTAEAAKLTISDLVESHRQAIGPFEALQRRTSTAAVGKVKLKLLVGGSGQLEGSALLGSEPERQVFLFQFGSRDYDKDHFVVRGNDWDVAFVSPGARSVLGDFIFTHEQLVTKGPFGGIFSSKWPLLGEDASRAKPKFLKYRGLKKVDGRRLHAVDYRLRGASGVRIRFFFDSETFRHVFTRYFVEIQAGLGATPEASAGLRNTRITLEEAFGNFKEVEGLSLPTAWTIRYSREGTQTTTLWRWDVNFSSVEVNRSVDDKYYSIRESSR